MNINIHCEPEKKSSGQMTKEFGRKNEDLAC